MTKTSDYIDSIRIIFPEDMKIQFLHMRNWPRTFDGWLKNRKNQLLLQKQALIQSMQVETDNVFFMVEEFQKQILELLERGLRSVNTKSSQERVKQITDMFAAMHPDKIQGPVPVEVPRETTF